VAPPPIAILLATLAQYQHDFDGSRHMLEAVLARDPGNPQATLTLATIARVQGRYADSDRRCREVTVRIYRAACLAENMALRGQVDEGRRDVAMLLALPEAQGAAGASLRQWLTTTLAELEERAGNDDAADAAYRSALGLGRDSYLSLDYVDFLIAHQRDAEAEALLTREPRPYGDGVLLRLAIVQKEAKEATARELAAELHDRFEAAKERGDAISIHGRELARSMFAVEGDAKGAVVVARDNLRIQKEPADFLVMAEAARAAGDTAALRDVDAQAKAIGLVDRRLRAIVDR
jgi:Tfp pilus assembly protein PilF